MYRIGKEEIDAVARAINTKDFFKINNLKGWNKYGYEFFGYDRNEGPYRRH